MNYIAKRNLKSFKEINHTKPEKFKVGDFVKHIDGRVGLIQRIDLKKTYAITVVFDEKVIKGILKQGIRISEYEIEVFTLHGASDWRNGEVKIKKHVIGQIN